VFCAGRAARAEPEEFEAVALHLEAETAAAQAARAGPEISGQAKLDVLQCPATRAYEVLVGVGDRIEAAGIVAELQLGDEAFAGEPVERVVDGGERDAGAAAAHHAVNFRGRGMITARTQGIQDGRAMRGEMQGS